MPPIQVFDLGEGGVDTDSAPTRTAPNALKSSQNATYDGTRQRRGGLSKRPGLDRFNTQPMNGVVLGGLEAPYKGTAGAPASGGGGGGAPGDPGGTGPIAPGGPGVGPGDGAGGGGGDGQIEVNGRLFNGGVKIFGGKRLVVIGRMQNSAATAGWYVTSPGFVDAAWKVNTIGDLSAGPPQAPHNTNFPDGAAYGNNVMSPMCIANGRIYYADDIFNQLAAVAPVLPNIRKLEADGNVDSRILTIPDNPAILALSTVPSHLVSVMHMLTEWGNGDACWVSTYDQITNGASAGKYGRILRISGLDAGAYRVQEVYNFFTNPVGGATASVPLPLENFLGRAWVGIWHGVNTTDPAFMRIVPTGEDTWGLDKSQSIGTPGSASDITALRAWNGKLYVGITTRNAGVGHATLWSFTPDDVLTLELTGTGGVAVSPTGFLSMAVFRDKLYASYFSDGQAGKIYEFDGTTWTAVVPAGSTASGYNLRVDGDYLYAFGGIPASTTHSFLATADGTTWVDKNANFVGTVSGHGDFNVSAPSSNILVGFEQ